MSRVAAALRLSGFVLVTLLGLPFQQLFVVVSPAAARNFPHYYHRLVCRILGIRLTVRGAPLRGQPCLLAANHVSWLDIPVLSAAAPVSFVAKREVNGWAGFGLLARLQRTVFIDRDRRQTTGVKRDEMAERLKAGDLLVLFAEGTSTDGLRVRPFKSAFFGAAEIPGVAVQPVTVAYVRHWGLAMTRRRRPNYAWYGDMDLPPHLWEALGSGPVSVEVTFHPPLPDGGRKAVAAAAEGVIRKSLREALHARPAAAGGTAAHAH